MLPQLSNGKGVPPGKGRAFSLEKPDLINRRGRPAPGARGVPALQG